MLVMKYVKGGIIAFSGTKLRGHQCQMHPRNIVDFGTIQIGWEEHLQYDMFSVEWDVKP